VISRRRTGAVALLAGAVVAALGALAACGGGGSSGAAPGASPSGVQAELAAYVSCLNQHGVTMALPSGGPGGFGGGNRPTGRPTGEFPSGRPTARPSGSGFPGGGGFGGGFLQKPANVDQDTWDTAVAACSPLRPSFGGRGGGPSGGAGGGPGGDNGAQAAYRNCLRDHGVTDVASPSAEAEAACAVLKPTGTPSS
jgi:hypothetical protein